MADPHWRYRDPMEPALHEAVSADTLMEHTRAIAAHERESGSPGEAIAFDHIEAALRRHGLAVDRRQIDAFISLPQEGRLVLPGGESIEGLAHSFSPSAAGIDAELVDGKRCPAVWIGAHQGLRFVLPAELASRLRPPLRAWRTHSRPTTSQRSVWKRSGPLVRARARDDFIPVEAPGVSRTSP